MLRQRPHRAEPGVDDRDQDGLGPAGHDRRCVPPADRLTRLSHGATPGRAGRHHRHVWATQPECDGDMPRGGVDEHVLNEGRTDPFQPALLEDALLFEEDRQSTRRASEDHTDVVQQTVLREPGIGECLLGGDQRQLGIAVHSAELLWFDPAGGIEALHLTGDLHRVFAGVEERHLADPRLPFEHGGPGTGRIETNRRHRPHACHDDALHPNGDGVRTRATSRSLRVTTCASWLMRRIRPESTWPGPISRNSALPRVTLSTTEEVHCTGLRMWSASSLRMSSALVRIWPVMLATTGIRGCRSGSRATISPNCAAARAIRGEWGAILIGSRTTRAAPRARASSAARSSAGDSPERTIWPGEFALATVMTPTAAASATTPSMTSRSSPNTASMPPGRSLPVSFIKRPRSRTRTSALSKSMTSAATSAVNSPRLWPAT